MGDWSATKIERYIKYALIILSATLVLLFGFFVLQYQVLRHEQITRHHGPLPVADASVIRTWMTFDYINKLFALTPEYLQTSLKITDSHYPRITIANYAANQHESVGVLLSQVQQAVLWYNSSKPW
jgi:hypothetical protein